MILRPAFLSSHLYSRHSSSNLHKSATFVSKKGNVMADEDEGVWHKADLLQDVIKIENNSFSFHISLVDADQNSKICSLQH